MADNPFTQDQAAALGLPAPVDPGLLQQLAARYGSWWQQGMDNLQPVMAGGHINFLNPFVGSILGFHGTPHEFPAEPGAPFGRFKNEAIGSGEGAQAYGWGHYVAGNPATAETYKEAGGISPTYKGIEYEKAGLGEIPWYAMTNLRENKGDIDTTITQLNRIAARYTGEWDKGIKQKTIDMANWLDSNRADISWPGSGHLLEVHIKPDEDQLLDWDRPLGEQSPDIQQKLQQLTNLQSIAERGKDVYLPNIDPNGTVKNLLSQIAHVVGTGYRHSTASRRAVSQTLNNIGIPGIKYLDQGSRAAGEGTHNYVIFDPSNLEIRGRNGEKLTPVDHDPFETGLINP